MEIGIDDDNYEENNQDAGNEAQEDDVTAVDILDAVIDGSFDPADVVDNDDDNFEDTSDQDDDLANDNDDNDTGDEDLDAEIAELQNQLVELEESDPNQDDDNQAGVDSGNAQDNDKDKGKAPDDQEKDGEDNKSEEDEIIATIDEEEFKKYKDFHDQLVNAEFTANGKKVKGVATVDGLIQSQRLARDYSLKMQGFKKYNPLIKTLKEQGLDENTDKFNLALQLLEGDKGALKKHLEDLGIDPRYDFDTESEEDQSLKFVPKDYRPSDSKMAYEDMLDEASTHGNEKKIHSILMEEWDDDSMAAVIGSEGARKALVEQVNNGVYDEVQEIVQKLEDRDYGFRGKTAFEKYNYASEIWNETHQVRKETPEEIRQRLVEEMSGRTAEPQSSYTPVKDVVEHTPQVDRVKVEAEKAKLAKQQELAEYKRKLEQRETELEEYRNAASRSSKPKNSPKNNGLKYDPSSVSELEGEDVSAYLDALINGDIK